MEHGILLFVKKNHNPKTKTVHSVAISIIFFTLSRSVQGEGKNLKKILGRVQLRSGGLKSLTEPSGAS